MIVRNNFSTTNRWTSLNKIQVLYTEGNKLRFFVRFLNGRDFFFGKSIRIVDRMHLV